MSLHTTFMLSPSVIEYVDLVSKITEPRTPKEYLDFVFELSSELAYKKACVNYFAPEIGARLIHILQVSQNTLEEGRSSHELTDEEYDDYELMIQDAIDRIQEIVLPEDSFFCTWINGEYHSVKVDADGKLYEEYKYDQKVADRRTFPTLKEWMNEYKINSEKIEVAVPMDGCDYEYDYAAVV